MPQRKLLGAIALLAMLTGTAARADHRHDYRPDYRPDYRSQPQVRFGVDVIWGGYGFRPAPAAAWYPPYYAPAPVYYGPPGYYGGRDHWKHRHHRHHRDDRDDRDDCDECDD